ncbi:MAG: SIMPL domain-containing protein [Halobacteria archaeon]
MKGRKDNLKNLSVALMVAGLVVTLVAAGAVTDDAGAQTTVDQDETDRHIQVSAGGGAETEPDKAVIRVSVRARSDDPSEARRMVSNNASRMTDALENAGVDKDNITTEGFDLREVKRHVRPTKERPERDEPVYVADQTYRIETIDVEGAGHLVDVAVKNGASTVEDISFTLSESTRRNLKSQALKDAMDNARSQADSIGDAGDLSVEGVRSVTTQNVGFSPFRFETDMAKAGGDAGTELRSGPVTVKAVIDVIYDVS